jgi:hypothetical protein
MAAPYGKAVSANPYKKVSGVIYFGGTADGINATVVPARTTVGFGGRNQNGIMKVVTNLTGKAISAGKFGVQEAGQYIIIGYMSRLASTDNSKLNRPAADFGRRSINRLETAHTLLSRTAGWNYTTGAYLTTPSVSADNFGTDYEARSSRALPGRYAMYLSGPARSGSRALPTHTYYPAGTD